VKAHSLTEAAVKERVRERDGHRCTDCGMTNEEHKARYKGKSLDVHRKQPGSAYTADGCLTLCRGCHNTRPKSKPGENPRSRSFVRIRPDIFAAMKALATAGKRPLSWEVRLALVAWLRSKGRWPQED
jgi:5-methylcytosine-specific restriction endonuclease McrA